MLSQDLARYVELQHRLGFRSRVQNTLLKSYVAFAERHDDRAIRFRRGRIVGLQYRDRQLSSSRARSAFEEASANRAPEFMIYGTSLPYAPWSSAGKIATPSAAMSLLSAPTSTMPTSPTPIGTCRRRRS